MIWRLVKTTMFIQSLVPILILSVISSNSGRVAFFFALKRFFSHHRFAI